jgi:signal transduction histidine kinase/streptogramin lyase
MQRIYVILACFFVCANSFAQQYPFVHYTPKDGLVNSRVKKAYQDSRGRMYFLTYGGLSVYNGIRFKNYSILDGLENNLVNDILEAGNDSLLVATNSGKDLNLLVKGKIRRMYIESNCPVVNQFYRHEDGNIYLSSDNGLFKLEKNKIRELNISSLIFLDKVTGAGNFLVFSSSEMKSSKGLYLYDIKNNKVVDSIFKTAYLIGKDRDNNIWVSVANHLFILEKGLFEKGKLAVAVPTGNYVQANGYATVNIAFDNDCAWFVCRNKEFRNAKIHRIDKKGSFLQMPLPEKAAASVLTNIFIDREKTIWLCNDGEGVFKIVNSPLQVFEKAFDGPMNGNITHAFCCQNNTWFSSSINKLFRETGSGVSEYRSNKSPAPQIFHDDDNKLLAIDHSNIYKGTWSDQNKMIHFQKIISLSDADFFTKSQIAHQNGNIIAGVRSGLKVWLEGKQIFYLPFEDSQDVIEDLVIDKDNFLWVVKRFTGIDIFSLHPESSTNYLQRALHISKDQIRGSVRSFVIDKTGLIWIGTRDDGVSCYKRQDNQLKLLRNFSSANGLSDNFVTSLACDSLDNIIVGTQTGLDRILRSDKNTFLVESLSKNSNYFSFISQVWADAKQAYGLSSSGALLQVSSPSNENTTSTPSLLLEEIKVNAKTVATEKMYFTYKENNLGFFVAAPSFIDEKQVRYSYLLKGSGNDHWSDTTSTNAVINLSNLSAGKYILMVKAFFPSASYLPAESSYPFEITPPWWQTWWFITIFGILLTGLLIISFRFYFRRRLEKQMAAFERQQAIEKERTRIATDMHDDLGAGLSRIKFLSETIGIKKQQEQPIEEDISKIREYSHEMIDKMGEIVWALNEKNDSLSDLLAYSRSYAVEYLSQRGIGCKVEAPDNFPAVFVSGEFRRNIYLTVKEALHNIVKHAQANNVMISFSIDESLKIVLQDDGIGFDKEHIRLYSNGLANMEKRMKDINGDIEIKNSNGTTVELSAPLG